MEIRIPRKLLWRKRRVVAAMLTLLLTVAFLSGASFIQTVDAQAVLIDFDASGLGGETVTNPTSLQFGPDGRLYVSEQSGNIYAYDIVRNGPNDYDVVAVETITLVKNITNYDDDGTSTNTTNRQITGIYLTGTGVNPVMYVSSSDPRIGAGGGGEDKGLDTNSGVISKLTCTGGVQVNGGASTCQGWEMVHLVRGLPRSEENHAVNGMQLDEVNNILYLAVGGHTNAGAPSNNFALITEYVYASAVLTIDLDQLEDDANYPIQIDGAGEAYRYDLPTLDDPTRANVFPDGTPASEDPNDANYSPLDENDPWGGNDGLNQAKIDIGGPVQLYASGFRNLYDIVITQDGKMYGVDNGANQGWGGHPIGEADYPAETTVGLCTHEYDPSEPGSTSIGPGGDSVVNNQNGLHYIRTLEPGDLNYVQPNEMYYGGHPTPIRGNPAGAGLYTKFEERNSQNQIISSTTFWRTQILDVTDPNFETQSLPVDWPPFPESMAYAAECDFRDSGEDDNSLSNYTDSTNGIAEYTASNFGGALQGYLLLASYNNKIYQVELSADGKTALNCPTRPPLGTTVATCSIGSAEFASNFGSTPLDVIAQGDTDPFGGTVWSVTYGANSITVFEPGDYDGSDPNVCTGADDDTIDEDGDGYTNADEIDNNSNPCSGAVQPTDFDKTLEYTANDTDFLRSDLNDNDDDNDTLVDTIDPFPLDCSNGLGGSCDAIALGFVDIGGGLQFFNETGYGFGTLGLTGIMTNGTTDYLDLIDNVNNELVFGGTAGIYTDVSVADTTPVGAGGNHVNGWQFSLNTDINTEPFQIETQMNGPLFSALTSGDSAWQGLQIGTGDQDNFIMFVLEEDDLGTRFRVYAENNGVEIYNVTATAPTSVLDPGTIRMYLSPDPAAGTVQASYQFVPQSGNVGPLTTVGIAVPLQGDALAALQGTYTLSGVPSALAIGMVGNSTQADPPVGMSWDFFNIDIVPSSAEAFVSAATNGLLGSTFNPGSIVVENNSEPGITITNVTFDLAGAMIPEIVFDPDGTAGDDVGRGFFPDTAEETATGATNAVFSDAYEGGFYELSVDFTDFDPGEQISFGVDIDPVSVKGGSAPGPGESASVSGLEMAGSTVTVTYSNGETQVVELYRTQPDADSAAQNIVTNAKPLTPSIEIAGESSQTILFDEAQTINVIADAEDTVYLLQLETAMFLDGLDGPNAPDGYNVDPWEVNSILTISEYESTVANGGVASIPVSLLNTDPEGGFNIFAAVVVKTLEGGDIVTSDLSNYIIVKYDPASAPNSSYRINAGGVTIPATDGGLNWESVGDGAQSGTGYSVNGGILIAFEVDSLDPSVPSYAPLSLFAEEKFDAPGDANMIWTFDVDPDTYIVRLFMGNGFDGADQIGDREFGINIEGTQVLTGFDPVEEFGHKVGGMKEFVVENTDGVIDIEFIPGIENPLINAIEISPYDVGAETPILVTNIPNQINVEGQAADFDVAATGGDGGSLVYTAEGLPPGIGLQPTNGDIIGTVDFGAADNSPYNVTITVDDNDFTSVDAVTVNFLWTISDGSAPVESVVYRVNSGGPSIAAADDSLPAWSADLDNPNSPFLSQAGSNSTFTSGDPITNDVSIPASVPEALLQSSRFDLAGGDEMAYSFPIEAGTDVIIRLLFAETFIDTTDGNGGNDGPRIFDVAVDGVVPPIFDDIDKESDFGHDVGFMLTFQTVSDGAVDLEFLRFAENPSIMGIEIAEVIPAVDNTLPIVDFPSKNGLTTTFEGEPIEIPITATDADNEPLTLSAFIDFDPADDGNRFPAPFPYELTDNGDGTGVLRIEPRLGDSAGTEPQFYTVSITAADTRDEVTEVTFLGVFPSQLGNDISVTGTTLPPVSPGEVLQTTLTVNGPTSGDPVTINNLELFGDDAVNFTVSSATALPVILAVGETTTLNLEFVAGVEGAYSTDLRIFYRDGANIGRYTVVDLTAVATDAAEQTPLICVNAGGAGLTAFGRTFQADTGGTSAYFTNGTQFGDAGADGLLDITNQDGSDLVGSAEDVFQTERNGGQTTTMIFSLDASNTLDNNPLPAGDYTVDLYFAETFFGVQGAGLGQGAGARVFDVTAEGGTITIADDLDLFTVPEPDAPLKAITIKTSAINVTDGTLTLEFDASVDNAKISGLCVLPATDENIPPVFSVVDDVTYGVLAEFGVGDTIERLVVDAIDIDGDNITYGATGLPNGLTMNAASGEVVGVIDENAFTGGPLNDGVYPVTVTATDDGTPSEQNSTMFNMTVVNREVQILAPLEGEDIPKSDTLTVSWTSTGGETDPGYFDHVHVYFYEAGNPNGLFDGSEPLNGTLDITSESGGDSDPNNNDGRWAALFDGDGVLIPGEYVIEIRHSNPAHVEYTTGLGDFYASTVQFTVTDTLANDPPMVTNPGDQVNIEGDTVSLQINATPPEVDQTLTYSAQNLPPSLTIDENTGLISGTLDVGSSDNSVEGAFIEENGIVVIEMESAPALPGDWETAATVTLSQNIDDPGDATGGDYIAWEGTQFFGTPGNGTITYPIQITEAGTYQFNWRTQVGIGTNTTEHNDTWLKIDADTFFGERFDGNIVCPIGLNPADNDCVGDPPEGAGGGGWFKIFSSGAQTWTWGAATSDFDSHQIFATFDAPGFYNIQISARSSGHVIDRMVLYKTDFSGNPLNTALAESDQTGPVTPIDGSAGQYNVTVTATDDAVPPAQNSVMFIWNVFAEEGIPGAKLAINTGGGINSSSFGSNSFIITNIGDVDITNVTIDTSTAFLPDVVFDPAGTAGDPNPKCLTQGTLTVGAPGITVPANGGTDTADCESVHDTFHNGVDASDGYDDLSLDFTDFNAGEAFSFGLDLDPTTIKGGIGTGGAGLISGFELIGATVTVTFDDGTVLSGTLGDEGSLGGSEAVLIPVVPAAPTNIALNGFSITPTITNDPTQTLNITGTPNSTVEVVQVDARLHIDPSDPTIGYDVDPFEANEAIAKVVTTVNLDGSGNGSLPVTLLRTAGISGEPDAGINHFIAYTVVTTDGETVRSLASDVVVIEYDPAYTTPALEFAEETGGSLDFELTQGESTSAQFTLLTDNGLPFSGTAPIATTEAWASTITAAAYNTPYALTIDATGLAPGNYVATLNAGNIPGFNSTSLLLNLTVNPVPTATEICINVGGPEIIENSRTFIAADQGAGITNFVGPNYSFTTQGVFTKDGGAATIDTTDASLEGAYTDAIFNTERFGSPMTWTIPVINGNYQVELFFAEIFVGVDGGGGAGLGNGTRVFSVDVDGNTTPDLTNLDLFAEYGDLYGVMLPVNTLVADNEINITFTASSDNAKVSAICVIPFNDPPVITLDGDNPQEVEADATVDTYVEAGATATDTEDGDISGSIVIDASAVDTTTIGSYDVTYTVTDSGGETATETRTVNVVDTTAPVIVIDGGNAVTIEQGSTYTPPVVTATDSLDGDISGDIVVGGDTVDTNTPGVYNVTYDVTDAAGNAATQVVYEVTVTAEPDVTPPVITIDGDITELTVPVFSIYTPPTVTATDNIDGDISGDIVVGGDTVDANTVGVYVVTFNVSDAAGNAAQEKTLTVNVVDNEAPVITLTGAASVDINLGDDFSTTDPGATALDNVDGDISGDIVVDYSNINPNMVGTYTVTYNVADAAGNDADEVTRTVNVLGAPANVDIVAQTASNVVGLGEVFTVDIVIDTDQEVDSAEIHLEFDPAVLQVVSLTAGTKLESVLQNTSDNTLGTVDYDAGTTVTPNPSADFTLVTITFSAVAEAAATELAFTTAGIEINDVYFKGGSVLNTTIGLTLEVTSTATLNGTTTRQGRPAAPDPSYIETKTITLFPTNGDPALPDYTVTSDANGHFTIEDIPAGTYDIAVRGETSLVTMVENVVLGAGDVETIDFGELKEGDANADNAVTLPDFSIMSASYGLREGDIGYLPAADFTGDDYVSLRDFILLLENYGQEGASPAD